MPGRRRKTGNKRGRPVGTVVELHVHDIPRIAPDDVITTRLGRRYRVLSVRRLRDGQNKLHARIEAHDAPLPSGTMVHRIRWYGDRGAIGIGMRSRRIP